MPLSIAPQASLLRVSTLVPQTARIGVASATLGGVAVGLKDSVREARGEETVVEAVIVVLEVEVVGEVMGLEEDEESGEAVDAELSGEDGREGEVRLGRRKGG